MKIRMGFISNSSSTSFVVVYKKSEYFPGICKKIDLFDLIEYSEQKDFETEITYTDKEEICQYFKEDYKLDDDEYSDLVQKIEEMDKEKEGIMLFTMSYHNTLIKRMMNAMEELGEIKILYEEND
jgi:hypothetical protein